MALSAGSLEEEVAYARAYAATVRQNGQKSICIAFAGFSTRDIKEFSKKCGIASLDGAYDPKTDPIVICDLEQTKGYEFDTLIILNCVDGVLPPRDAPVEESYRASCKLYVAMTRAKRELILSFHGKASPWIEAVSNTIGVESWSAFEHFDLNLLQGTPELLPEMEPDREIDEVGRLTGLQFVYTAHSLGLSLEAQDKLIELVDGRGLLRAKGGPRLKWQNISSVVADLVENHRPDQQLGPTVAAQLREFLPVAIKQSRNAVQE